jgi:hypothetical protein
MPQDSFVLLRNICAGGTAAIPSPLSKRKDGYFIKQLLTRKKARSFDGC